MWWYCRGVAAVGLWLYQHDGIGDWTLAHRVEASVVGGVVNDAVGAVVSDVHGGGATAVEVGGITASQPPHDAGEFG